MVQELFSSMKRGIALLALCGSAILFAACDSARQDLASDPSCSPPTLKKMTGYFVSKDGFYGPDRIEYLNVKLDDGSLVATKLVGDRNVPRGKVSWFTVGPHECLRDQSLLLIKFQIRTNANDPNGFFWTDENYLNNIRALDENTLLVNVDCGIGCFIDGRLLRVTEMQALQAQNSIKDHE